MESGREDDKDQVLKTRIRIEISFISTSRTMSAAALLSCKLGSASAYDQDVNTLLCLAPNQKLFQIVFSPELVLLFDALALYLQQVGLGNAVL